MSADTPGAFGFLDPALVIRAVHMIPDFSGERVSDILPKWSMMRSVKDEEEDEDDGEW